MCYVEIDKIGKPSFLAHLKQKHLLGGGDVLMGWQFVEYGKLFNKQKPL
jgi:hypothetical protein